MSNDKLKNKTEELARKANEWEDEKKKLVIDLRSKWQPADDEPDDVRDLKTQTELVE